MTSGSAPMKKQLVEVGMASCSYAPAVGANERQRAERVWSISCQRITWSVVIGMAALQPFSRCREGDNKGIIDYATLSEGISQECVRFVFS
jgi:hypothetical protein